MIERSFIPGSKWIYFKLYTGHKAADNILIEGIRNLVKDMMKEKIIDDFFFIRYSDPKHHLRVRFLIRRTELYSEVFSRFYSVIEPLFSDKIIRSVQCDTYDREIERYGESTMVSSERFFGVDSFYVIELLHSLYTYSDDRETDRWLLSLKLIDDILDAFNYTLEEKIEISTLIANAFKAEFGFTEKNFSKQLNEKYRNLKSSIAKDFSPKEFYNGLLDSRRQKLIPIADQIRQLESEYDRDISKNDKLISFIHMTMNRWFPSKNRIYEMVIYEFLMRSYKSSYALRAK